MVLRGGTANTSPQVFRPKHLTRTTTGRFFSGNPYLLVAKTATCKPASIMQLRKAMFSAGCYETSLLSSSPCSVATTSERRPPARRFRRVAAFFCSAGPEKMPVERSEGVFTSGLPVELRLHSVVLAFSQATPILINSVAKSFRFITSFKRDLPHKEPMSAIPVAKARVRVIRDPKGLIGLYSALSHWSFCFYLVQAQWERS